MSLTDNVDEMAFSAGKLCYFLKTCYQRERAHPFVPADDRVFHYSKQFLAAINLSIQTSGWILMQSDSIANFEGKDSNRSHLKDVHHSISQLAKDTAKEFRQIRHKFGQIQRSNTNFDENGPRFEQGSTIEDLLNSLAYFIDWWATMESTFKDLSMKAEMRKRDTGTLSLRADQEKLRSAREQCHYYKNKLSGITAPYLSPTTGSGVSGGSGYPSIKLALGQQAQHLRTFSA